MTTVIKRTTTRKQLAALLKGKKHTLKKKGVDVKSFAGKLKLDGDPLAIQKQMRDGWKQVVGRHQHHPVCAERRQGLDRTARWAAPLHLVHYTHRIAQLPEDRPGREGPHRALSGIGPCDRKQRNDQHGRDHTAPEIRVGSARCFDRSQRTLRKCAPDDRGQGLQEGGAGDRTPVVPEVRPTHAHLTERGYTTTVEGIRLVRGPVPELQVEMVFGWGQAERIEKKEARRIAGLLRWWAVRR